MARKYRGVGKRNMNILFEEGGARDRGLEEGTIILLATVQLSPKEEESYAGQNLPFSSYPSRPSDIFPFTDFFLPPSITRPCPVPCPLPAAASRYHLLPS
jgi:hypothetical protein